MSEAWKKAARLAKAYAKRYHEARTGHKSNRGKNMKVGDVVRLEECGDFERDLLCAGLIAMVVDIDGDKAFVNSDIPRVRQATRFKQWWPMDKLKIVRLGEAYERPE